MITQIATTQEQAAELIDIGINPMSADMYYTEEGTLMIGRYEEALIKNNLITPAWSASALWDILPSEYVYPQEMGCQRKWALTLEKPFGGCFQIDELGYEHTKTAGGYYYDTDMCSGENLVECLCKLVFCALRSKNENWAELTLYDKPYE